MATKAWYLYTDDFGNTYAHKMDTAIAAALTQVAAPSGTPKLTGQQFKPRHATFRSPVGTTGPFTYHRYVVGDPQFGALVPGTQITPTGGVTQVMVGVSDEKHLTATVNYG